MALDLFSLTEKATAKTFEEIYRSGSALFDEESQESVLTSVGETARRTAT